jgi:hypothetical protein
MKRTLDISGTGSTPGQVNTAHRRSSSVSTILLIVLGAMTIEFSRLYIASGEYGLPAYLSGMLATGVFLLLCALLASRSCTKKTSPTSPKVRAVLISTVQGDPDPLVRSAAARGLAELDLEESTEHLEHDDLDTILISTLQQDPDPRVRSAAAEGLAELELEQSSYHHEHNKLEDILFEHGLS